MFKKELYIGSKKEQYDTVCKQLDMLIKGESNIVVQNKILKNQIH